MRSSLFSGVLLVACLAFSTPSPAVLAANPVQAALPPGARLITSGAIPGYAGRYAVAYRAQASYLGVVDDSGATARLVWTHPLPGSSPSLTIPGPQGVFLAVVRDAQRPGAWLLAYRFRPGGITSAIAGRSAGSVYGDEGVRLGDRTFSVRNRDATHVGSVRYRTVQRYSWSNGSYRKSATIRRPDYATSAYPRPDGVIHTRSGDVILIRLEVAATDQQRATGLMYRKSLDPDSGMVFVWTEPVLESFWMENTYIPLTVAFLAPDGTIQEMQDMAPLTQTTHTPQTSYQYAIEVNQGFFAANGIGVGDRVQLNLTPAGS